MSGKATSIKFRPRESVPVPATREASFKVTDGNLLFKLH